MSAIIQNNKLEAKYSKSKTNSYSYEFHMSTSGKFYIIENQKKYWLLEQVIGREFLRVTNFIQTEDLSSVGKDFCALKNYLEQ